MPKTPSEPRLAGTVLLLRDGPSGLEVFMVERHHQIDFATGALVFPGGKVEESDAAPELLARCRTAPDDELIPLQIASLRETFEESGVLLARPRGEERLIEGARMAELAERDRLEVQSGDRLLLEVLEREDLELACDQLFRFAHWITPEMMPKRFDTHFYVAHAPADSAPVHDGSESVDSLWIGPNQAIADADAGKRTIIFPTRMNILKLAENQSASEAIERAQREPIVSVLPEMVVDGEKRSLRIPPEAGYPVTEIPIDRI